MGVFMIQEAFDYNNALRQIRALAQDHPQLQKSTPLNPTDTGFTVTGSGNGVGYVAAGANMATVPFQLQCTLGGGDGVATFDVIEDFGGLNTNRGTLTAGQRFTFTDSGEVNEIIVRTTVNWVVADTIDFTMVAGTLGAEAWTENRFTEPAPDGNGDFIQEWVASGPSIAGGDSIDIGFQTLFDNPLQKYNMRIEGADGFVGGSAFGSQPNGSPLKYVYLNNQPMPMWIVVTGDYITGIIRAVPGVYQSFFAGFIELFGTPGVHGKPILVGGSGSTNGFTKNENLDTGHSCFWDPGEQQLSGTGDGLGSAVFRWVDGLWLDFRNRNTSTTPAGGPGKQFTPIRWIQPYNDQDSSYQTSNIPTSTGFGWSELCQRIKTRPSGRYNLRPMEMFITDPQSAAIGQIPAWKYICGFGVNPEDTVSDTSPVFEGVVTQNIFRTDRDRFAVLQLDV